MHDSNKSWKACLSANPSMYIDRPLALIAEDIDYFLSYTFLLLKRMHYRLGWVFNLSNHPSPTIDLQKPSQVPHKELRFAGWSLYSTPPEINPTPRSSTPSILALPFLAHHCKDILFDLLCAAKTNIAKLDEHFQPPKTPLSIRGLLYYSPADKSRTIHPHLEKRGWVGLLLTGLLG